MRKNLLYLSGILNIILLVGFVCIVNSLGGVSYLLFKMKNRGVAGTYENRKNLFMNLPNDSDEIIFLGNSITEQCEWSELFANPKIKNRGIAGDMTHGVLERLNEITASKPQKIFLMIGVNDLLFHQPETVIENYRLILNKIQKTTPNTKIYIQSILPVNNEVRKTKIENGDILIINKALEKLAKDYEIDYVDLHTLLKTKNGTLNAKYTADGIHINGEAYLVWKKAIAHLVID